MQTVLIEVTHPKAYKLLQDLEDLQLIKMVKRDSQPKMKLSERLAGSLTSQQADTLHKELQEMRDGWNRNI